jgi:hypothetical protein
MGKGKSGGKGKQKSRFVQMKSGPGGRLGSKKKRRLFEKNAADTEIRNLEAALSPRVLPYP